MKFLKKHIKKILALFLFLLLGGAALFLFVLSDWVKELPAIEQMDSRQMAQSTKIYDRSGTILLYEVHAEEKRTIIPFEEIPERLKQATITIEDDDFYQHPAFDWRAILRAFFKNLVYNQTQGGSTITQQLIKNSFLTSEKTLKRKIKELILAIQLERHYTKDKILGSYLNQIPYGANVYGIEAAAQNFFNKSAKEITLAEAAILAALPRAPSYYSPWGYHFDELKKRQEFVLDKMETLGFIDAEEKERALKTKLVFAPPSQGNIKAPHFVMEVKEELINRYGEEIVEKGGLKVITSLDYELQTKAEEAIAAGASRNEKLYQGKNAALVAQDAKTGQILALVGSRDYFDVSNEGNFSVATRGLRQPGSALKPFAYLTAFQKGYSPETIVFDVPTEFTAEHPSCPTIVNFQNENTACYHPQNFDQKFRGAIELKNALAQSINVPSIKVLYLAGLTKTLKTLNNFGINTLTDPLRYGLSLVLGGGEIKLIELVKAYSVLSQEGIKRPQIMILKVENSEGEVLEEYQEKNERVIENIYPQMINMILSDKELRRPLFSNSLNLTVFPEQEVALKTGTTNDFRDAWALGYTPSFVVGVWAGNNNNTPMQKQGGSILAAVPIWSQFMTEILKRQPLTETFTRTEFSLPEKPILRGESIIKYQAEGMEYPQIHNILYFVDKDNPLGPAPLNPENDPQFKNWEEGLMEWLKTNLPDFNRYNQTPPNFAIINQNQPNTNLEILEFSPHNGEFIRNIINIKAIIKSASSINKIELFFNGQLVDAKDANVSGIYEYQKQITVSKTELQNSLKIKITDIAGNITEKETIVFGE